jgi:transcriptional antiterminator RfaH
MTSYSYPTHVEQPWYLIHCQPRKEFYAAIVLEKRLALGVFLPEYEIRSRGNRRQIPFFPGYIFVQADLQKVPRSQINTSPGVIHLVDFGGDPLPVPACVVEEIAERLKQANTFCQPSLRPGDLVRLKHRGPLQDLEMVFIGPTTPSRRVCVLLNLLGRMKEIHVEIESLERIPDRVSEVIRSASHA